MSRMPLPARRILLVEDDPDTRALVALLLRPVGETVACGDAYQGLARLRDEPFDLVVTDVLLPGVTGVELLRRARDAGFTTLPFVVVTGMAGHPLVTEAVALGATIVAKPFDASALAAAIEAAGVPLAPAPALV